MSFQFHGYGLLIGIAIVVGWWWVERVVRERRLSSNLIERAKWLAVIGGIIGARLYHVVDYWSYYRVNPFEIVKLWQGGLGIWGAILGGAAGIVIITRSKRNQTIILIEAAAMAMPLAQAIGRLGNWVNGELYGKHGEPLFMLESLMNLGLFWWINFGLKKEVGKGQRLGGYLIGYGLIRLVLEPLRERVWSIWGVPTAMLLGLSSIVVGIILICRLKKQIS